MQWDNNRFHDQIVGRAENKLLEIRYFGDEMFFEAQSRKVANGLDQVAG